MLDPNNIKIGDRVRNVRETPPRLGTITETPATTDGQHVRIVWDWVTSTELWWIAATGLEPLKRP